MKRDARRPTVSTGDFQEYTQKADREFDEKV